MRLPEYPRRPPYFSQRFIRLMIKTASAQTIGTDAFALLAVVVTTEDARRYAGPVAFFNEQLMMLLGFGSRKRLVAARDRAIAAGWLLYSVGGKGIAGRYFVCIPPEFEQIPDGPSDESGEICRSDTEHKAEQKAAGETVCRSDTEPKRGAMRNGKGTPYIPIPIPNPISANADLLNSEFAEFWQVVTKKKDKLEARKAYKAARRKYQAGFILELAKAYYSQSIEAQYLKHPATFLRQSLEDDPSEWKQANGPGQSNRPELKPFARARV